MANCRELLRLYLCFLIVDYVTTVSGVQVNVSTIPVGNIIKYVNEDLNLTCRVNTNTSPSYEVVWKVPREGEKGRVWTYRHQNELTITIRRLQESDSGAYMCEVNGNDILLQRVVQVTVHSEHKCSDDQFTCFHGICILRRFVCDGFVDCPGGQDENLSLCGPDPCKNKMHCDGRCIRPELCCDPSTSPDCMGLFFAPCCYKNSDKPLSSGKSENNVIKSTVYTIVSCVVAFVFITVIMVIAVCRIHMKRTAMASLNQSYLQSRANDSSIAGFSRRLFYWPWANNNHLNSSVVSNEMIGDDEMVGGQSRQMPRPFPCSISSAGSFVVMYSTGNGVQLVERLPKPPPYTEEALLLLGPPPAYTSTENLQNRTSLCSLELD